MRTLLVASQKGGVGKTTTAVNLAAIAAQNGGRVLLLDADPLGSVTTSLHLSRTGDGEIAPRPDGVTRKGAIWTNVLPGLDVVNPYPADSTGEEHLIEFLQQLPSSPIPRFYTTVIIDAPPMLGPRPKALLKASDDVLIVQRAEPLSFRTLPQYLDLIKEVQSEGGRCRMKGILLTLPSGMRVGDKSEQKLRQRFPGLLPQSIPFDAEVNRALVLGQPVVVTATNSIVAKQYQSLAIHCGLTGTVVPPMASEAEMFEPMGTTATRAASAGGTATLAPPVIGSAALTETPPEGIKIPKARKPVAAETRDDAEDFDKPLPTWAMVLASVVLILGGAAVAWILATQNLFGK